MHNKYWIFGTVIDVIKKLTNLPRGKAANALSLLGMLFIVCSLFGFAYKVPILESQIRQEIREIYFFQTKGVSSILYFTAGVTNDNLNVVLNEVNPDSPYFFGLNNDTRNLFINAITGYDFMVHGPPLNKTLASQLSTLSIEELSERHYETLIQATAHDSYASQRKIVLEELQSQRVNLLFWCVVLQVIGLLLNQVAMMMKSKR